MKRRDWRYRSRSVEIGRLVSWSRQGFDFANDMNIGEFLYLILVVGVAYWAFNTLRDYF